ncbi:KRAB-A domain-containing protein 2 [Tribolium castaneum]|uniref:KRAB-A domain-containing protein 2-like Protein n=1 Tax=Tribolium castaneum TaxID=7070 RepID=D6WZQ4_TRICA|nr:PREDICTED: KRAB-A domain-containing protein 2 [Tribolium castaneum]EFA09663.1 KRAB-A domain-containing protein 2-like Protein [Tribolium castaneum]|eukprot:XP_974139.1 PREDICTED: KRAB-A domain-containing protein 2 [Tribolium castaneum]
MLHSLLKNSEQAFKAKIREDRASVNRLGTNLTLDEYKFIISKVLKAKSNQEFQLPSDKTLLDKYDVLEVSNGAKKLIVPSNETSKTIFYVHDNELYQILLEAHLHLNHGNCDEMLQYLNHSYKNITYKDVSIFLSFCQDCDDKAALDEKDLIEKYSHFNTVCQIELIDFESCPDHDYKFVMIYQELLTKFVLLKPLNSYESEEVAENLINIFGTLGPPIYLKSNVGGDFVEGIIDRLKVLWPPVKIEHLKSDRWDDLIGPEIETMVKVWMTNNKKKQWSEGLRFVQLKKNTTIHPKLEKTPYEALFRHPVETLDQKKEESEDFQETEMDVKEELLDEPEHDPLELSEALEIAKTEPHD